LDDFYCDSDFDGTFLDAKKILRKPGIELVFHLFFSKISAGIDGAFIDGKGIPSQ
jgi:hypothetical protein